ncbi:pilus assembly protein TadG-related protein [Endozoicomonas sp. GU-1]|uniref:pilus assembly protein TadG-related protein n=1 Tax=Endozoicomonas sp. GU-1 TaxID=3009078 RepID=UPI0022B57E98|nr:pilus assembly protein TadG-related protein [Endozoicomonas sp. GU-1]WBA79848.1 pilus assembly protein TadG-related protein [Endozoicomonas sp. GU-1]WBA87423.1 pilus assembly protein TadG-related protein [Endozoicomonas sp. GU-1]
MQDKRRLSHIFIKRKQRGAVAVVVAITLTGVMAMMGLAVDTGNIISQRDKLQNIANAAALSAAKTYYFPNEKYSKVKKTQKTLFGQWVKGPNNLICNFPRLLEDEVTLTVAIPLQSPKRYHRFFSA